MQERLNSERFPWEVNGGGPPPPVVAPPVSAPAVAPPLPAPVIAPPAALPPAPTLQAPANCSSISGTQAPTFSWVPVPGAIQYQFEYWDNSPCDGKPSVILGPGDDPLGTYGYLRQYGSPYFWRVRAHTPAGWGPWSDTWSVSTTWMPEDRCELGPSGWHVTSWQPH